MTFDTVPATAHTPPEVVTEGSTIGELIEARRTAARLSKAALARQLGTSYQRIILWESDKHAPSAEYASSLAAILGGDELDYMAAPNAALTLRAEVEELAGALARLAEGVDAIADSVEALDERVRGLEQPHSAGQHSR